jgi:putative membrane protein
MIDVSSLPKLNALLNSCSLICLLLGYVSIKRQKENCHKRWMITAFIFSSAFLVFYLVYHFQVGHSNFQGTGLVKVIYLLILIPHIILAALMVPMIFGTFYFAFRQNWSSHKKLAKWTFPIWLYVSLTGIIIYLMLYVWFP